MTIEDDMLTAAAKDLLKAAPLTPKALERLDLQQRGVPGSGMSGGGSSPGPGASPVEAALNLSLGDEAKDGDYQMTPDRAAQTIKVLAKLKRRMRADAALFLTLVEAEIPHAPTAKDRRDVEQENRTDKSCQHCTDWRRPGNAENAEVNGTVAGNLPEPMNLCKWCYGFVYRNGILPTQKQVQANDDKTRVMIPAK